MVLDDIGRLLELGAAWHSGNLLNGAAAAIRSVREWDMAEGARCTERIQAVSALNFSYS